MDTRLVACALVAVLVGPPGPARADPFHAQTLPLGQRAIGMGGAYTANANDPSATYYNPAGIVLTSDVALSASLTLVAFDRAIVAGGYRTAGGRGSLNHRTGTSLPVFVSAVKQVGRRDEDGRKRHAVALSTFTVQQRNLRFDVQLRSPSASGQNLETLSIDDTDRTVWHGLSYAYRPRAGLSVGVTGFLSIKRRRYTEERIGAALGSINEDDGSFVSDRSVWTSHLVDNNVKNMLLRIGVLYRPSEQLRLGLMIQPPSVHVRGRAMVRARSLRSDLTASPPVGAFLNASEDKLVSRAPLPWELRFGASYLLYHWLTLSLDTSLYGPTGTKRKPVVAIGPRRPDPETGAVAEAGAFITETWYRNANANFALGGEAVIKDSIAIRGGFYSDFSSAPRVPRYSSRYRPPKVHRVGGTVSLGLVSDGFDISLGMIGVVGRGRALAFNSDPETSAVYARTSAKDRMFLFFVNGVKGAVKALTRRAEETLRELRSPSEPPARDEPR